MDAKVEDAIEYLLKAWSKANVTKDKFDIEEGSEEITVYVPEDHDAYSLGWEEFVELVEQMRNAEVNVKSGRVRTTGVSYQLVMAENENAQAALDFRNMGLEVEMHEHLSISYVDDSLLLTFLAVSHGAYSEYFAPSSYNALEIRYLTPQPSLSLKEESELIDSFLFDLAASHDFLLAKTEFQTDLELPPAYNETEDLSFKFTGQSDYNEGMPLFLAAMQVEDPDLRFLSFFKVLEFFAPVVFRLEENEAVRRKLESPDAVSPDAAYIQSLIELVRSLEKRKNDKEMMKTLFATCLDVIDLARHLPKTRRLPLTYESKRSEIEAFSRTLAEIVVATRNQVAHAKSNYESVGIELKVDEIRQFNEFMRLAAAQVIRWYNRLPEHQMILG